VSHNSFRVGSTKELSRFHLSYLAFLQNGIEAPRQQMRILVDRVIYQGLRYAIKPTRRL